MQEEYQTAKDGIQKCQDQLGAKEQSMTMLRNEKEDCLERLQKVQQELKLIEEFEKEQAQSIGKIKDDQQKREQEISFIENALAPLQQEKEKTRMLIESIAPHLLYQLQP